jgi:general secretion pathway protein A
MLSQYFGFQEEPFGATPDPRWLYRSAKHREALASLRYGFYSNRGFTALIAPPGLGKTTLLFQFLHDIRNSTRIVFLFDTQCEPLGLLRYILRDLGVAPAVNGDEMHVQLEDLLVKEARSGRRVVVVVDEAQNLSDEALEMLRLLTNYETPRAKLLHIVLSGQPLLADTLMKPSMEQLRQRVTTSCWLEPFSMEETTAYIRHRLEQAGYRGAPLFRKDALRRIMVASHGIPRIINNLCFNALSLCCEQKRKQVDGSMAAEAIAIQELDPESRKKITDRWEVAARQPIQPQQLLPHEKPIQPAQLLQPELRAERLPQPEQPLQPKQPAQAEEPKPVLRRLMVPAAAALLVASGIGLFSLSAHWQPWSRLTGYLQSLDTKVLSALRSRSSQPNISTRIVATPSSIPSPPNTNEQSASIPTLATTDLSRATITEPPAKTKPSPAKALSPPMHAPVLANRGRVTVAEPPSQTTPSATRVVSLPIPPPALANRGRVTVAEPPSQTTPSATRVVSLPIPPPAVANIDRVTVAEPPAKTKPFQITAGPNQTLHDICVRYLGIWDPKRLHEIQALNPNLTDLDHIQAGQKIWLPAPEPAPMAQPSTAQAHLSPPLGTSSNANITPSATTAAVRDPAGGNRGAAESPHAASKVAHAGLPSVTGTAGGGSYGKVAPAPIPGVVKGTAAAKMPVAPVPAEMLPKPIESSNPAEQGTPNCGGVVEIPCPKLKIRPTSPPD